MQFTLSSTAPAAAAQLFTCAEASQLTDATAQILFNSLAEKDSFAAAQIPDSGSLKIGRIGF